MGVDRDGEARAQTQQDVPWVPEKVNVFTHVLSHTHRANNSALHANSVAAYAVINAEMF